MNYYLLRKKRGKRSWGFGKNKIENMQTKKIDDILEAISKQQE